MPQSCTICTHDEHDAIDTAIVSGEPYRRIAARFDLAESSVRRHRTAHLPAELVRAQSNVDVASAEALLDRLRALNRETGAVLKAAKASGQYELMLKAIARAEKQLELEARLLGELREGETIVNVLVLPEFLAAQQVIVAALHPFPDARLAVADALAQLTPGGR